MLGARRRKSEEKDEEGGREAKEGDGRGIGPWGREKQKTDWKADQTVDGQR